MVLGQKIDWLYAFLLSVVFTGVLFFIPAIESSLPSRIADFLAKPVGFLTVLLIGERHPDLAAVITLILVSLGFYTLCFAFVIVAVRHLKSRRGCEGAR